MFIFLSPVNFHWGVAINKLFAFLGYELTSLQKRSEMEVLPSMWFFL